MAAKEASGDRPVGAKFLTEGAASGLWTWPSWPETAALICASRHRTSTAAVEKEILDGAAMITSAFVVAALLSYLYTHVEIQAIKKESH